MTYNRDLQEDKERLFDSADTVQATLEIVAEMLGDIRVKTVACMAAAADPLLLATDLADWLVKAGVPFRKAHHAVGAAVALAEKKNTPIHRLSVAELRKIHPAFTAAALKVFDLEKALAARKMAGAPNRAQMKKELVRWSGVLSR